MPASTSYTPAVMAISISPNPVYVGEQVKISISVIDVAVIPSDALHLSGEFQSGEV